MKRIPTDKINKMRRFIYKFEYNWHRYLGFSKLEAAEMVGKIINRLNTKKSIAQEYFRVKQYTLSKQDIKDKETYQIRIYA